MKYAMPIIQEKLITSKPDTTINIFVTKNPCNEILVNYILVKFWKTIKVTSSYMLIIKAKHLLIQVWFNNIVGYTIATNHCF
jgi:hypothetical protein